MIPPAKKLARSDLKNAKSLIIKCEDSGRPDLNCPKWPAPNAKRINENHDESTRLHPTESH
jgi:hypothetical protein